MEAMVQRVHEFPSRSRPRFPACGSTTGRSCHRLGSMRTHRCTVPTLRASSCYVKEPRSHHNTTPRGCQHKTTRPRLSYIHYHERPEPPPTRGEWGRIGDFPLSLHYVHISKSHLSMLLCARKRKRLRAQALARASGRGHAVCLAIECSGYICSAFNH